MSKAQDEIIKMLLRHNFVFLEFQIVAVHKHVYDEGRALESSIQESMEEDDDRSCMVPTVESSIELLEMKKIMKYGMTCSICMEEFPGNGGCEGVIMQLGYKKMDKSWMNARKFSPEYVRGVDTFMNFDMEHLGKECEIKCPCANCLNSYIHSQIKYIVGSN
ncbi:hypothetical protein BUALT_Bualt07G0107700 [Buddleja alternifolia]|uniref:Transposase-associated domain-containing protein n=1 Tax=Buddleja alternifolia TaxID=168488 RepID=A0AAV6XKN8_9LAMI|nr:hypothetical protein BUALT_Bualt07G0107700 [Buddleja alternifolia]